MIRACAWCGKELETTGSSRAITHTICGDCFDNLVFQLGVDLRRYLDSLPAPVAVMNGDGVVVMVNAMACQVLGKTPEMMEQNPGGIVFECAYARLPGGCGNTVHCSGCTIRRTVMATFSSGRNVNGAPAYLTQSLSGLHDISLRISTELAGNVVLLRIDGMQDIDFVPAIPPAALEDELQNVQRKA